MVCSRPALIRLHPSRTSELLKADAEGFAQGGLAETLCDPQGCERPPIDRSASVAVSALSSSS